MHVRKHTLPLLILLLAAAAALRLCIGPGGLSWPQEGAWMLRIDRTLSGIVVGAALAMGGVLLQALLRNPLASPDLIGPSSGAGFAVALSIYLSRGAGIAMSGASMTGLHSTAALIGACGALALVYILSQHHGLVQPVQLVLVGVVISIMFGAGTMFITFLMPDRGLVSGRWTIGALSDDAPDAARIVGLVLVGATLIAAPLCARFLDAVSLSDDEAASIGVPIRAVRVSTFVAAGALTAAAVVLAGPVGFVGLIAPHLVRSLAGPGHRILLPASAACGAAIVVLADAATRMITLSSGRMPLGVVTAILGGGFFIWIARSQIAQYHAYQKHR